MKHPWGRLTKSKPYAQLRQNWGVLTNFRPSPWLFIAGLIGALFVLTHVLAGDWAIGSYNSICYLLSALGQAQAAIVAIVATMAVVSFQLSPAYSTRMMDLFLGYKSFWIIMLLYGVSISYDFLLLAKITHDNFTNYTIPIWLSLALSMLALAALLYFARTTMWKIRPQTIIDDLIMETKHPRQSKALSAMHSIYDILRKAVVTYDFETAIYCIHKVSELCITNDKSSLTDSHDIKGGRKHYTDLFLTFCSEYAQDLINLRYTHELTKEVLKVLLKLEWQDVSLKPKIRCIVYTIAAKLQEERFNEILEDLKAEGGSEINSLELDALG